MLLPTQSKAIQTEPKNEHTIAEQISDATRRFHHPVCYWESERSDFLGMCDVCMLCLQGFN